MSEEEESNTDEDGRFHAGPAQAAQQGPVLPVMTLEKNTSNQLELHFLVEVEELIITIFWSVLM